MERRFLSVAACPVQIETRANGKPCLVGYGSVFYDANDPGTEYELYSELKERIMPSAFDRCIKEAQDVRGLFNHDPNCLLGRTAAGTMRLSIDRKGLRYEIDPPDTQAGRDVVESVRRGDLTGSSFSFRVIKQTFTSDDDDEMDIREIHDLECYDTGPVTFPAYTATSAGMRSEDLAEVRSAYDAWKIETSPPPVAETPPPDAKPVTPRSVVMAQARSVEIESGVSNGKANRR